MAKDKYQRDLSIQSPILLDRKYKAPKIDKMRSILMDANIINPQYPSGILVDIGCSAGLFTSSLAQYFDTAIGVDIDIHALNLAVQKHSAPNILYSLSDSQNLPLIDNSIDAIICNHVYEHVPDAHQLFSEIYRVLKPGGSCYFGAASRLTPIEPHYHLPFLSWLPKPLSNLYMRITGKGIFYYENLTTLSGLMNLTRKFQRIDYTLKVVEDPDFYHARDLIPKNSLVDRLPLIVWRTFFRFLPTYIFILRKPV